MREIVTLRRRGITTITDLAGVDLDELLEWYLPEVTHRSGAEAPAADRGPAGPDAAGRASGSRARPTARSRCRRPTSRSTSTSRAPPTGGSTCGDSWSRRHQPSRASTPSSADSTISTTRPRPRSPSRRSAGCASVIDGPAAGSWSTTTAGTRWPGSARWPTASDDPLLDWAAEYAEEHFVDLLEIVKAHYFGVAGLGLKLMAQHAGFRWRDDDPGGLNSQRWFADAVHGADAEVARGRARSGCWSTTRTTCIATSQLRAWLRAQ